MGGRLEAPLDQGVVDPVGHVVEVLHADDRSDRPRLGDLLRVDRADPEVADQALRAELGQCLELLGDRSGFGAVEGAHAEVDHVQHIEAEMVQVVVDG